MPPVSVATIALAFGLDLTVREFPEPLHPVAWYGTLLDRVDRAWDRPRLVGSILAIGLPVGVGCLAGVATAAASRYHPALGAGIAGLVLFASTSLRMLLDAARDVIDLSEQDPTSARDRLRWLVGRDPEELSVGEVRSAAVESAAENLSDGLVAPLVAFTLLSWSLPLAAGAGAWVKAVNTGDSMLGYHPKPIGWAFARLDDIVMWLPARLTALVIAIAALEPGAVVTARRWAGEVPSPNAGWPMATLAVVTDARLEKPGTYVLQPAAVLPSVDVARRGVRVVGRAGLLAVGAAGVIAWH